MYVDLVNGDNYLSINISLANMIGLTEAVYVSELLSILKKAIRKNKLIDGNYVKIDRKFVKSRTTLSPDTQREIDAKLAGLDLLAIHPTMKDVVSVNSLGIVSLISLDEEDIEKDTLDAMTRVFRTKTGSESNHLKGRAIAKSLKRAVCTANPYLRSLMNAWIDKLLESTALTKAAVNDFQDKVFRYSSDVNVVRDIINLAIENKFAYAEAAIDAYGKQAKKDVGAIRVTTQRRATRDDLEKGVLF